MPEETPLKPEGDPAEIAAKLAALNREIEQLRKKIADHYSSAQKQFGPEFVEAMRNPSAYLRQKAQGAALYPQQPAQRAISPDALYADRLPSDEVQSLDAGSGTQIDPQNVPPGNGYYTRLLMEDAGKGVENTGSVSPAHQAAESPRAGSLDSGSLGPMLEGLSPASPQSSFRFSGDSWMDRLASTGTVDEAPAGEVTSAPARNIELNPGSQISGGDSDEISLGSLPQGSPSPLQLGSPRLSGDSWMDHLASDANADKARAGEATSAPARNTELNPGSQISGGVSDEFSLGNLPQGSPPPLQHGSPRLSGDSWMDRLASTGTVDEAATGEETSASADRPPSTDEVATLGKRNTTDTQRREQERSRNFYFGR